jgi:hypothetical protein
MSTPPLEAPLEILRVLARRAGLQLSEEELAEVRRLYDPVEVARLRELNLEPIEPACIYIPS